MKCFSLWFAALFYYMLCIRALHAPTDGKCIFGIHLPNRTVYNFSSAVQKNGFFFSCIWYQWWSSWMPEFGNFFSHQAITFNNTQRN